VFLCVSGHACLRMPAGGFVLNAEDSAATEYIHMMRSFWEVRGIGKGSFSWPMVGTAVHRNGTHRAFSILTGEMLPGSRRWCSLGILKLKGTLGVDTWDSRDGGHNAGLQMSMRRRVRS